MQITSVCGRPPDYRAVPVAKLAELMRSAQQHIVEAAAPFNGLLKRRDSRVLGDAARSSERFARRADKLSPLMSRPAVFTSQTYDEALASAKATGKLLVLDATAAWCQPCKTMDRVTWSDARVVAWLEEHAVAVQLDVDEEKAVAASLGIRAMPTAVAFREGVEFDRVVGMKRPDELIAWLVGVQRGETGIDPLRRAVAANAGDMQARYGLARALLASRRFMEATDEYEWLWLHSSSTSRRWWASATRTC
jgi:thiol-disulfide isomerase/thioredoxin